MFFYFSYITLPNHKKSQKLFDFAKKDIFYATIIAMLENRDFTIQHNYWGRPGSYIPQSSSKAPAKFRFSYRHGYSIVAHTFLHELIHFKQDMESRLPRLINAQSEESYIQNVLACEAEAEIEALAASWRLKNAGHPQAWRGALLSFDWRRLAKLYQKDMESGLDEKRAMENAHRRWQTLPQKSYYQSHAQKLIKGKSGDR